MKIITLLSLSIRTLDKRNTLNRLECSFRRGDCFSIIEINLITKFYTKVLIS